MLALELTQLAARLPGLGAGERPEGGTHNVLGLFVHLGPRLGHARHELLRHRRAQAVGHPTVVLGRLGEAVPDLRPGALPLPQTLGGDELAVGLGVEAPPLAAGGPEGGPFLPGLRRPEPRRVVEPAQEAADRVGL